MVVLWYATQQKAAGDQPLMSNEVETQLQSMEKLLDRVLQG
jgi:hypothetical protein